MERPPKPLWVRVWLSAVAAAGMFVAGYATYSIGGARAWMIAASGAIAGIGAELLIFRLRRMSSRVHRPPGARLDELASFIFSRGTYERVLQPCLGDMLGEYFEALNHGKRGKARWVRVRGTLAFWGTVALQLPVSATRVVKTIWMISGT